MQVRRVHLAYTPVSGQWALRYLTAVGELIKQDGTLGKAEATLDYTRLSSAPDWVRHVADKFQPTEPAPVVPTQGLSYTYTPED